MATIAEQAPESGGRDPQPPPRSRRPWIWVGVVAATASAIWAYAVLSAPSSLVGTWSNRAADNPVEFTFNDDGSGAMTIGAARLPYRYQFDRTRKPAWLDLDATVEGREVAIRAIAQFARKDKLKIRMPHTRALDIRPTEFVDNDLENTILLTRVEPGS